MFTCPWCQPPVHAPKPGTVDPTPFGYPALHVPRSIEPICHSQLDHGSRPGSSSSGSAYIMRSASKTCERLVIRFLLPSSHPGSLSKLPMITDPLHVRSTATFSMAQTPLQGVSRTLLGFTPQTLLCSLLSTEGDHFGDNSRVYGGEDPYSDPALYQSTFGHPGHSPCPSLLTVYQLLPWISTDIVISVHPIESYSFREPQNWGGSTGGSSIYAHALPPYWVIPVATQPITSLWPLAHVTPSSSSPAPPPLPQTPTPTLAPPLLPQTQTPANSHLLDLLGTQKENDLIKLEQEITSSPWYAANAVEPPCGSPDCPHTADCYGIRGVSCYTAFVIAQPAGTFGCWRCHAYSARKLEDAVKHQRSNHFNHKPFLCVPANGSIW